MTKLMFEQRTDENIWHSVLIALQQEVVLNLPTVWHTLLRLVKPIQIETMSVLSIRNTKHVDALKDEWFVVRVVLRKEVLRRAAVRTVALAEDDDAIVRNLVLSSAVARRLAHA